MKLLVGLGNPGPRYANTRHNLGYRVAEAFAERHGVRRFRESGNSLTATVRLSGSELLVAKPLTYMNESGLAVRALMGRGVDAADIVVAHDDLDLELGDVRLKRGGGDGGQRGLRSIIAELGSADFVRVRLGIKRTGTDVDAAEWVLEPFPPEQEETAAAMVRRGADATDAVCRLGAERAMNQFNRKPKPKPEPAMPDLLAPPSDGGATH